MSWLLVWISFIVPALAADKTYCTARELRRYDCRMTSGGHRMRLLRETIARDDGVWHAVDEMPLQGEWEKMRFEKMAGRPILQLWIWDAGTGEAQVQSLRWYVTEVGKEKMKVLAEGVVKRRRPRSEKSSDYIYDKTEKHELKATKNGNLEWKLGAQHKILGTEPSAKKEDRHGI